MQKRCESINVDVGKPTEENLVVIIGHTLRVMRIVSLWWNIKKRGTEHSEEHCKYN